MAASDIRFCFRQSCCALFLASWLLAGGCASDQTKWLKVGKTTKAEVVDRYGEPDLVQTSADGETVVYRPVTQRPPVDITVARAGPSGIQIFQTEPVTPGLGTAIDPARTAAHPLAQLTIRYDNRGIVREVRQ